MPKFNKTSKSDNAYNINLLTDIINAMQLEISILKEKIKLIETYNKTLVEKVSNMIELCQTIVKSKIETDTENDTTSKQNAIIKNSSIYL
jgi:hypothetical protein